MPSAMPLGATVSGAALATAATSRIAKANTVLLMHRPDAQDARH